MNLSFAGGRVDALMEGEVTKTPVTDQSYTYVYTTVKINDGARIIFRYHMSAEEFVGWSSFRYYLSYSPTPGPTYAGPFPGW